MFNKPRLRKTQLERWIPASCTIVCFLDYLSFHTYCKRHSWCRWMCPEESHEN